MSDSEAQIAQAIIDAKDPLRITGGGTRGYAPIDIGTELSVAGLNGITLYDPAALTLVAKAGTPTADVETALAAEGQMLAFEPMDHRTLLGTKGIPTIGGIVAANVSGPRRVSSVGACRDSALGVRFIDGSGNIIKNGGRVMKNVTGYDLVKLMAGSFGTLGVLSEVSLKVLPVPETMATLRIETSDKKQAVAIMSAALSSPFEVTGAAFGAHQGMDSVFLRVEGFEASVAYRTEQLYELLSHDATIETDLETNQTLWANIRDMKMFSGHAYVARMSTKPSLFSKVAEKLQSVFRCDIACDWGGGLIWIAATQDQLAAGGGQTANKLTAQLRDGFNGHVTLLKCPDPTIQRFHPQSAPLNALSQGLRSKFDPRGILNQGLMD